MNAAIMKSTLAAIGLALCASAQAGAPDGITDAEVALLPQWCIHTQLFRDRYARGKDQYARYLKQHGPTWEHMHHYCWALIDMQRHDRALQTRNSRGYQVSRVLDNLTYTLERADLDFVLRPEMLLRGAQFLQRAGRLPEARKMAAQLVEERPEFADGYIVLADVLRQSNSNAEAAKVIDEGQQRASDPARFSKLRAEYKF